MAAGDLDRLDQRATGPRDDLPENTGGAGGFNHGLAWAMDHGADLVWLMDDDGLPEPDCLGTLLEREDLDFWGPAVAGRAGPRPALLPDPAARRRPGSCTSWPRSRRPRADGLIAGRA